MPRRKRPHTVCALIADGVAPFELGVACEVFGIQRPELHDPWYRFLVVSMDPPPVNTSIEAFKLVDVEPLSRLKEADTIVVPAWHHYLEPAPSEVLDALRAAHRRGARVLSVCTGAFLLAQAGLLDGRRATTHWMYVDDLERSFPKVEVEPGVLYVGEDGIFSSAGTAAGIDLCLHIVRLDFGTRVANGVARRMVVPPHRDGGQAQFVDAPYPTDCGDPLAAVLDWALEHLDEELPVERIAAEANMSPRTFARRFRAATGTTPLQWLLRQRVTAAMHLLEATDEPIEVVAARCGFGSAALLRDHFARQVRTTPQAYRRAFRQRVG